MKNSNSIGENISIFRRIAYLWKLVMLNRLRNPQNAIDTLEDLKKVSRSYEAVSDKPSKKSSVLEIGFGARPHRAFALQLVFDSVVAVDLDQPIFGFRDFTEAARINGLLRAIKGLVRSVVFDRGEWPAFHKALASIDSSYDVSQTKLCVANVADSSFWDQNPGPYDLIYSTDVFEHIPKEDLIETLRQMKLHLSESGICVLIPCIYTGIVGGHDPAWYRTKVDTNSATDAWNHLLDKDFVVDTYLNKLTRRDYDKIFEQAGFRCISQTVIYPNLGRQHYTDKVRKELEKDYDEYELFSNWVEYVLRCA